MTNEDKSFAELFDPHAPELVRAAAAKEAAPGNRKHPGRPGASLDLHGLTLAAAELRITAFIQRCQGLGIERVRIITGRGRHSPEGPVLKEGAERFLRRLKKEGRVAAVSWEGRERESGALIVRLR